MKEDLARFSREPKNDNDLSNLTGHFEKHEPIFSYRNEDEYDNAFHEFTMMPAAPIGKPSKNGVNGYRTQSEVNVKYRKSHDNIYEIAVYVGRADIGVGITYYKKSLNSILKDADPYAPYDTNIKQNDYRYKCDLNQKMKGLEYFDSHSEYHQNVDETILEEIKTKLLNGEKLGRLNTIR